MKIIVDAMGGDNAPQSNVRGAVAAIQEYGVEVILVGRGEEILRCLKNDGMDNLPAGLERRAEEAVNRIQLRRTIRDLEEAKGIVQVRGQETRSDRTCA